MIETVEVGTRRAYPSSLPAISGITSLRALAAPVEVGMMLIAAALARRRSECGRSRIFWSLVYACTVVMKPQAILKLSCATLTAGASPLVVQDALEITWCFAGS